VFFSFNKDRNNGRNVPSMPGGPIMPGLPLARPPSGILPRPGMIPGGPPLSMGPRPGMPGQSTGLPPRSGIMPQPGVPPRMMQQRPPPQMSLNGQPGLLRAPQMPPRMINDPLRAGRPNDWDNSKSININFGKIYYLLNIYLFYFYIISSFFLFNMKITYKSVRNKSHYLL
jgi:hypothetical protein